MHSKSCCALFLLALVACQAAPSSKIIEKKSISETETKLAEENLQPEDTGADKDRAKKSTTFCVELRSGKEEVVPCKNLEQKQLPVVHVKTPEYKPYTFVQTAPVSGPQYPVSNVLIQPVQPQPQPAEVVVQPNVYQVPQPAPQFIHVQAPPQQPSVVESAPQKSQQTVIPVATVPAPTPIINIIPAPVSAPCEHSSKPEPPQQQFHTVHIVPPQQPQNLPQPPKPQPEAKPQENIKHKPVPQKFEVVPVAPSPYKSEVIIAPPPLEYYYREEEPARVFEYVEAPQQEYECSCRSEQNQKRPYKHHVKLYPSSPRNSPMMAMQYNLNTLESDGTMPIFAAQTREAEARHHKKKQPLQITVQPIVYSSVPNYPPKYDEYQSYRPVYIKPTYSYPVTNYDSYSNENTPYSSVPLVTVNTGGPFYRNSQDSREDMEDTRSPQAISNINDISNNQKREASSIQLKNDEQGETAKALTKTDVENM